MHLGVNCAHPDHFTAALDADRAATARIGLLRANTSRASHAELDEAEELDDGNPEELANLYAALLDRHLHLEVLGGCCGTDARHVEGPLAEKFSNCDNSRPAPPPRWIPDGFLDAKSPWPQSPTSP